MKIQTFLSLIILSLAQLTNICNASDEHRENGTLKSQALRQLALRSKNYIINLNQSGYEYFVLQYPRPYDVVIYFTASNCQLCDQVEEELIQIVQFYKQANEFYPSRTGDPNKKKATYFARVQFSQDVQQIFMDNNFNVVPNLIVAPQRLAYVSKIERNIFLRDYTWQISSTDGQITASKLLEFINKKVQKNVVFKESILNLLYVIAVLGVVATLIYSIWNTILVKLAQDKQVQFYGSICIYTICLGGFVFNLINGTPFTNIDNNGEFEWWHSGGRHQFGAEGFLMSSLITLSGLIIAHFRYMQEFSKNALQQRILFFVSLFIIHQMIRFVENLYKRKSWYGPQFYPPDHYIRGSLMVDQGNTV